MLMGDLLSPSSRLHDALFHGFSFESTAPSSPRRNLCRSGLACGEETLRSLFRSALGQPPLQGASHTCAGGAREDLRQAVASGNSLTFL